MPRVCTICAHPERAAIDKALAGDDSIQAIAIRFNVSKQPLVRHKANHLAKVVRRVMERRERSSEAAVVEVVEAQEAEALDVMTELKRTFERVNLLFDACDRWLRDPVDPTRYDLGPRADELMVQYEEETTDSAGRPKTIRRKAPLSQLLAEVRGESGREITLVESRRADPRDLILKTAGRLQRQTELLAKLIGQLDERPLNLILAPEWISLRTALLSVLAEYPEARFAVADRLAALEVGDATDH